jgi:hypothetical protein
MDTIKIRTIDHQAQRYETVGDWYMPHAQRLEVRVSNLDNEDYEFLIGIHELVEAYLCYKRGISERDVTVFDIEFEKNRAAGNVDEPGNDLLAPYYKEHVFATEIESMVAFELGVNWSEYEAAVNALSQSQESAIAEGTSV